MYTLPVGIKSMELYLCLVKNLITGWTIMTAILMRMWNIQANQLTAIQYYIYCLEDEFYQIVPQTSTKNYVYTSINAHHYDEYITQILPIYI